MPSPAPGATNFVSILFLLIHCSLLSSSTLLALGLRNPCAKTREREREMEREKSRRSETFIKINTIPYHISQPYGGIRRVDWESGAGSGNDPQNKIKSLHLQSLPTPSRQHESSRTLLRFLLASLPRPTRSVRIASN